MNTTTRERYTTREEILEMLTDEETARVSTAEGSPMSEGDEYIDLTAVSKGVMRVDGVAVSIGHVLPRRAVGDVTWSNILSHLT